MHNLRNIKYYIVSVFAMLFVLLANNTALAIEKENIFPSQNCLETVFSKQVKGLEFGKAISNCDF